MAASDAYQASAVRRSHSSRTSPPTTTRAWSRDVASPRRAESSTPSRPPSSSTRQAEATWGASSAPQGQQALGGHRRCSGSGPDCISSSQAMDTQPAFILGRRADILASNRLANALLADFDKMPPRERNYARWILLDEHARDLFLDWEVQARAAVENLRLDVAKDPQDQAAADLIADLDERSPEFRRWWTEHKVYQRTYGTKRLRHPLVGEFDDLLRVTHLPRRPRPDPLRLLDRGRHDIARGDAPPRELARAHQRATQHQ